jgi:hypothetical protein
MSTERWFRIGDGILGLDSDDSPLNERFDEIYGECAVPDPGDLPTVGCRVKSTTAGVEVSFDDPEPLNVPRFAAAAFPGRPWDAEVSADGRTLRATRASEWRPFVANLAVSRTQRLQRHIMFFHAASLSVGGQGLLACGPKRSGKTTLAMALACRGHDLFGDEVAAVRLLSRELLPVRRSLAVREGPASAPARAALKEIKPETELFPDGERRARAAVRSLFAAPAAASAPLTTVLLLRNFAAAPAAEAAAASPALLSQLTPLAASLWDRPAGAVTVQLMRLLSASRVFWIDAGPPEQTAVLVEHLLETS